MLTSNITNQVYHSQIVPKPTRRKGTHPEDDATLAYKAPRFSSLSYPVSPTKLLRGRYIKSGISPDGYWFMHCPRCGFHFPEVCLEPLGIYTKPAFRTEHGEYTGTELAIGVYCPRCGLTDRLNIGGWQPRGFVPWWWE